MSKLFMFIAFSIILIGALVGVVAAVLQSILGGLALVLVIGGFIMLGFAGSMVEIRE